MAINALQRNAFLGSSDFTTDVDAIWLQEALALADKADATDEQKQLAKDILDGTTTYQNYTVAMVADAGWTLTFDAWANDRDSGENVIRAGVQKMMSHLS